MGRNWWEFVEDGVAWLGGYDPHSEGAQQKFSSTCVWLGSVGVVSASTVTLLWKLKVLQKAMPSTLREHVQAVADEVAALTEPPSVTALDRGAASHMLEVYTKTGANFALSFLGVYGYFKNPYVPMPLAIGATAVPAMLVAFLPKTHINPKSRRALLATCAIGCGFSFGPINWIAYDCTVFAGVSALASSAGFSASALLTRGKVSFFVVSQLLSTSLAVLGSHAVMHTTLGFSQASQRVQSASTVSGINAVLMLQLVTNCAVALCHSLPTLMRFDEKAEAVRKFKKDNGIPDDVPVEAPGVDEKFGVEDPDKEALFIFGAAAYATWTWFRYVATAVVLQVTGKKGAHPAGPKGADAHGRLNERTLREAAKTHERLARVSDFAASIAFLYFYVKFVGYLQASANAGRTFDASRRVFARLAPFALVA